jgi:predicted MFS family arabinose efflux permease
MTRREIGIIAATFLGQAVAIGSTVGPFTIFIRPLEIAFNAESGPPIEIGISLILVMLGTTGFFTGQWLDRGAPRRVMMTGLALLASALWLASHATELWHLGAMCLLAGAGVPMLGPLTTAAVIGRAFDETRGRALGIANAGVNIGGMLFAMTAAYMLEPYGWRSTLQTFSVMALIMAGPAIWFLIPARLEAPGATIDGEPEEAWPVQRLARSRLFWLTAGILGVGVGVATGWSVQVSPFLLDLGASVAGAGTFVALSQGIAIIGTFGFGYLADKRDPVALIAWVLGIQATCLVVYVAAPSLPIVSTGILISGLVTGGLMPLYAVLLSRRFGVATLGMAMGLSNLCLLPLSMALPVLAGALRASTGSYNAMISICIVLLVVGLVMLLVGSREERMIKLQPGS